MRSRDAPRLHVVAERHESNSQVGDAAPRKLCTRLKMFDSSPGAISPDVVGIGMLKRATAPTH